MAKQQTRTINDDRSEQLAAMKVIVAELEKIDSVSSRDNIVRALVELLDVDVNRP